MRCRRAPGLLLDTTVYSDSARTRALTLVSSNLRDMDLLLQVGGPAPVLLYET